MTQQQDTIELERGTEQSELDVRAVAAEAQAEQAVQPEQAWEGIPACSGLKQLKIA